MLTGICQPGGSWTRVSLPVTPELCLLSSASGVVLCAPVVPDGPGRTRSAWRSDPFVVVTFSMLTALIAQMPGKWKRLDPGRGGAA